jgi:hypothetical protein
MFFLLHVEHLVLVSNVNSLQVLFLELEFLLLVTQLTPQALFFLVEMQENLDISVKLCFLLLFDDSLDVSVPLNVNLLIFQKAFIFFHQFVLHLHFQTPELLCFLDDMFLHSLFHLLQVLLINLPCFPQCESHLVLDRTFFVFLVLLGLQKNLLPIK